MRNKFPGNLIGGPDAQHTYMTTVEQKIVRLKKRIAEIEWYMTRADVQRNKELQGNLDRSHKKMRALIKSIPAPPMRGDQNR